MSVSPLPWAAGDPTPLPKSAISAWADLRRFTAARIALGRSGGSLPTREALQFALDHALARDAVHAPFDPEALAAQLRELPTAPPIVVLASAAPDRATYLRRPNLGRRLSECSAAQLATLRSTSRFLPEENQRTSENGARLSVAIIVSNGLSALAAQRQASPLLRQLLPRLAQAEFEVAPLCIVQNARVGILDEIGAGLGADFALIALGERPGLGTPDSLSVYFTYAPALGRSDADRNCVSNIRPAGLPPDAAALKLVTWMIDARAERYSGVRLKEPSVERWQRTTEVLRQ